MLRVPPLGPSDSAVFLQVHRHPLEQGTRRQRLTTRNHISIVTVPNYNHKTRFPPQVINRITQRIQGRVIQWGRKDGGGSTEGYSYFRRRQAATRVKTAAYCRL